MDSDQSAGPFGELLRELRTAAGVTQEELADAAGLSPRGISDLERGARRSPRPDTVRRLAAALELDAADRAALELAARSPRPLSTSVLQTRPAPLTSFVGRAREQAELLRLMADKRVITLTGVGGMGKTRLARVVAEQAVPGLATQVVVLELGSLTDPLLVARELAAAIGIMDQADCPLVESISAALRPTAVLLVLDSCEHLLPACRELASALLGACPRLRLLSTSREPLGLADETVWPVPALDTGTPHDCSVERVARLGAVRLFVDRARGVWPGFEITTANARTVAGVCRRLDGIPLAIELAAARLRVLTVEQIADRLEDRYGLYRLLVWGAATAPARHQTLAATVDWSYTLLSDSDKLLFDRLSVFRGGCSLEAAESICAFGRLHRADVVDRLQSLVEKSLVVVADASERSRRFGQLETLREYAQARLAERGETATVKTRLLEHFLALAEGAASQLHGPHQLEALERLERDHDNLRVALGWAEQQLPQRELGVRLATSLAWFWQVRGHTAEGDRWLRALLADAEHTPLAIRARALNAAGTLAFVRADYERARSLHEASLGLSRQTGDQAQTALALNSLANVATQRGDDARATALYHESLTLSLARGDQRAAANALYNLGVVARRQKQLDHAAALYRRALGAYVEIGDRSAEGRTLHALGNVAFDCRDVAAATAHYREALRLGQELRNQDVLVRCLESLAPIVATQGHQPRVAVQLVAAAHTVRQAIGMPVTVQWRPEHERRLATLQQQLGDVVYAAAWKKGSSLSPERAVALALDVQLPC